ncbi:MAG TPA: hypothetical protein PK539_03405 [Candidatus Paceibacterota bacterium]|nr:hypothetical protein [Candidatus Paceibacterota bacterium]
MSLKTLTTRAILVLCTLALASAVPAGTAFAQYGGSGVSFATGPGGSSSSYCFKIGGLHIAGGYNSAGGSGLNIGSGSCAGFGGGVFGLASFFLSLINGVLVPLIFAIAFIVFLWGMFRYFIAGGDNPEEQEKGKRLLLYGVLGFVIMVSLWGIVNVVAFTFGLGGSSAPPLPYL